MAKLYQHSGYYYHYYSQMPYLMTSLPTFFLSKQKYWTYPLFILASLRTSAYGWPSLATAGLLVIVSMRPLSIREAPSAGGKEGPFHRLWFSFNFINIRIFRTFIYYLLRCSTRFEW